MNLGLARGSWTGPQLELQAGEAETRSPLTEACCVIRSQVCPAILAAQMREIGDCRGVGATVVGVFDLMLQSKVSLLFHFIHLGPS